jgi:hypothetical protein
MAGVPLRSHFYENRSLGMLTNEALAPNGNSAETFCSAGQEPLAEVGLWLGMTR